MNIKALVQAARKTLVDSADDVAGGIDALASATTDSKVLDEIPFIGTGVKILKAKDRFVEHRFRRNCIALLEACSAANHSERERLWSKLSASEDVLADFTDTLLLITADSSKPYKATIVGNLIAALCKEQISYGEYDALVHIVHAASIPALKAVESYFKKGAKSQGASIDEEPLLLSLGVANRFGTGFRVSDLGHRLYKLGMKGDSPWISAFDLEDEESRP
ncbi:hypothetical protein D9M68_441330 [compost metagenome]